MPFFPSGYFPPFPATSTPAAVPNPAETAWTVGTGTAGWDGRAVAGLDLVLAAVLKNGGQPIAYADDDTLDANIWRGQGEPPVVVPGVSWTSADDGAVSLTVPGVATANLDAGTYRFQAWVTAGGVTSLFFDGDITFLEAPGLGVMRAPYVTNRDLASFFDQVARLQSVDGSDATFLRQRVLASDDFDRDLVTRYDPVRGFVKTRRTTLHPALGTFDVPDPTAVPPTPKQLSDAIRAGGVIVDENVREIVAKITLARILEQQEAGPRGQNPFHEDAAAFRADVEALWMKYAIQVDTDLDGTADLLVDRDVILLPAGTAP